MKNLLRILKFFKGLRYRILAVVILGSISIIMYAFMPTFLKGAFDTLRAWLGGDGSAGSDAMFSVVKYLLIYGLLLLTNSVFDMFCTFMILKYENKVTVQQIVAVKKKTDLVPVSFLKQFATGDLSRRVATLTSQIIKTYLVTIYTVARVSVFFITTSIMMFMINWILALVVIMSLPLCVITARLVAKKSQKYFNRNGATWSETFNFIDQKFAQREFFSMHGLTEDDKWSAQNKKQTKATFGEEFAIAFNTVYINFIQNFMYLLVTFLFAVLYINKMTEFGALPAFLMFSNRFLENAVVVSTATSLLQQISSRSPRVFQILDAPNNDTDKEHIEIQKIKTGISFKNVSLSTNEGMLLDNLSFTIPQGAKVAFVGPAGSRKTKVVDLLAKLAQPSEGLIKVDGVSLDEITAKSYYKCVGVSFEKPFIFRGTVAENLLYGIRRELPENVMAVTDSLGSHDFIDNLENGYETWLSDNTSLIGVGQKQAIGVARLVLQRPDVAIFSESLSAVDTMMEKNIYERIMKNDKKQTTIFVTHRLSSVEKCDMIYYMDHGKIVEKGTHAELMAKRKRYYKAYMGE